ncbi:MAG: hypothetical protein IJ419_04485 [Agathobacter sp.]|nr:hypothetical protein [Agathobacter sp.]
MNHYRHQNISFKKLLFVILPFALVLCSCSFDTNPSQNTSETSSDTESENSLSFIENGFYVSTDPLSHYAIAYKTAPSFSSLDIGVNIEVYYGLLEHSIVESCYSSIRIFFENDTDEIYLIDELTTSEIGNDAYRVSLETYDNSNESLTKYIYHHYETITLPTTLFINNEGKINLSIIEYWTSSDGNINIGNASGVWIYYKKENNRIKLSTLPN